MQHGSRATNDSGREVEITRPAKVLFPESSITKGELIEYYRQIAPRMLPYLRGRPLTVERFPDGIGHPGFFQKSAPRYYPDWVKTVQLRKKGGAVRYIVCDDVSTLVYLANQASVTFHTCLSPADQPEVPHECIFDIDPPGDNIASAVHVALELRDVLAEVGAAAYVKATGARGLHVHVPLTPDSDYESTRSFARDLAGWLVAKDPERRTLEASKATRRGRVYLDVYRNAYAQTAVVAYSVRARVAAPLAVPLDWTELQHRGFRADRVTLRTAFDYLNRRDDPWKGFSRSAVSVEAAHQKFEDWKKQHTARTTRAAGPRSA